MHCCIFNYSSADEAMNHFNYETIEDFGDSEYDDNGNLLHSLHTWDDGYRALIRCKNCGNIFLKQFSEYHGLEDDDYYIDFYAVSSREEAVHLNLEYSGNEIEQNYKGLSVHSSNIGWVWNKR